MSMVTSLELATGGESIVEESSGKGCERTMYELN